jgi:deoxyribodipyrimidine photolyase-related protein
MSNYCASCRYDVKKRSGEDACPFNVFYWDFLIRHHRRFKSSRRMAMVLKNVERFDSQGKRAIRDRAEALRRALGV